LEDHVRLSISDDGQGFNTYLPRSGKHIGLWSMRERMEQLGGQFEIQSLPNQGTTIIARMPILK
jgi:two-component system, NarL family, sensor histidine kinase LiaS